MIDLDGKVVLVTGGSRGIGAAIVRTLAGAGADVALHYGQSRDAAEASAADLGEGRCCLVSADLADDAAPARLWADAMAWKGHIDVLVNNAGIFVDAGVDDDFATWSEVWARTLQVNLVAASHLCRDAVRHTQPRCVFELFLFLSENIVVCTDQRKLSKRPPADHVFSKSQLPSHKPSVLRRCQPTPMCNVSQSKQKASVVGSQFRLNVHSIGGWRFGMVPFIFLL